MENLEYKIAKGLLDIEAVKLSPEKPFLWASGLHSPIYCDNRKALSYPGFRRTICEAMIEVINADFKDIDVISTHGYLLEDLGKNMAAALFSDMVISGRDAGPELYSLYTGALDLLEFYDAESVVISFIAHYLRLAGLSGDYERCPVCQRIYGEDEVLGFSDAEGVAVCSECDTMSGSLILPPNARRFLARTLSLGIRESMDLRISPEQRHRIFRYMLRSLSLSFPGRLGSLEHGIWELDR